MGSFAPGSAASANVLDEEWRDCLKEGSISAGSVSTALSDHQCDRHLAPAKGDRAHEETPQSYSEGGARIPSRIDGQSMRISGISLGCSATFAVEGRCVCAIEMIKDQADQEPNEKSGPIGNGEPSHQ